VFVNNVARLEAIRFLKEVAQLSFGDSYYSSIFHVGSLTSVTTKKLIRMPGTNSYIRSGSVDARERLCPFDLFFVASVPVFLLVFGGVVSAYFLSFSSGFGSDFFSGFSSAFFLDFSSASLRAFSAASTLPGSPGFGEGGCSGRGDIDLSRAAHRLLSLSL